MDTLNLLKTLTITPGISGHEDAVARVVSDQLRTLVDDVSIDSMANDIPRIGTRDGVRLIPHEVSTEIVFHWRHATLVSTRQLGHRLILADTHVLRRIVEFVSSKSSHLILGFSTDDKRRMRAS